jgi:hypothetical protein
VLKVRPVSTELLVLMVSLALKVRPVSTELLVLMV